MRASVPDILRGAVAHRRNAIAHRQRRNDQIKRNAMEQPAIENERCAKMS